MPTKVLIIDDDPVQRRLIEAHLARIGFEAVSCDNGAAGLETLSRHTIAAVVLDLVMPGIDGLEVLAGMRRRGLAVPVVVQTAHGGIDTVVEAMRAGAFDFVVKPAPPDKLLRAISNAVRFGEASRERTHAIATPAQHRLGAPASAAIRPALGFAARAAASTIPVLIEGETGVGKEWLAEAIRASGPRASRPFVVVNCGALPAQLVESILFGHEKGAFTDAGERREGKFREADGGTLFLDEIGELPPEAQIKLLRALQKGEIDPVGGRAPVATDVRIISATNRDLAADVRSGRFREDLYYRLNVLPIRMPPLRERREEIAGLAEGFLKRFAGNEAGSGSRSFSKDAIDLLGRHDWPGNIRQLENAVHRAVVLAETTELGVRDFPQIAALSGTTEAGLANVDFGETDGAMVVPATADLSSLQHPLAQPHTPAAAPPPVATVGLSAFGADGELRRAHDVEADLIRLAILRYGGRMTEIARRLEIGRSTLYRKMKRYGIDEPKACRTQRQPTRSLRQTGDSSGVS